MDACADSRGIRRGGCTDPSCPCPSYDGGTEKKRCIKCGHPPGKHQNLDNPSVNMGTASGMMSNLSHTGYDMVPPPDLPPCAADGCTNKVWYDFNLREAFNYCSPECRDRHLLPIRRHALEEELEVMKKELERVAAKDSPKMMQRQQSNGHSAKSHDRQLPGQGHSSPAPTASASSASTAVKAASAGKGRVVVKGVTIEKKAHKPSGLILSKKPYGTDKAEVLGFVIVGVVRDTPAYSKLQDDQIRLLDVIETVNNTPCHELFIPDVDLQDRFEHYIDKSDGIKLELNRCIALPPVSKPLSVAKKKSPKYNHVTVLMYSKECQNDAYGLILEQECKVKGAVTNSPGEVSRVKFGDKIKMYAVATRDGIQDGKVVSEKELSLMKRDLQAAHQRENSVILFIKKSDKVSHM